MLKHLLSNRTALKTLTLFGALFLCVMSGACLTIELYKGTKAPLQEQIRGFFLNPAQQQIVFIGQKNHYIFPLPDDLRQILSLPQHHLINSTDLSFVISRGNSIKGRYTLSISSSDALTVDEQNALLSAGFIEREKPKPPRNTVPTGAQVLAAPYPRFVYRGQLDRGVVYSSGKFALPQIETLTIPLNLTIRYDYASTGQTISRVLLTPLTVAADGVSVVVGAVVLVPILAISGATHIH
jgi:hypothetical protein